MVSKLLTAVVFIALFGCESKEYQKSQNSNIEVVSELNQGEHEKVIVKLSSRQDLNSREKYYLASALSTQGGVDVFSLYSVLELQLFRKNALEWSDLSKEKNPYLKFMKSQDGVDFELRRKKREARWTIYEPKLITHYDLTAEKPALEEIIKSRGTYHTLTQEAYDRIDELLEKKAGEFLQKPGTTTERMENWYSYCYSNENPELLTYFELCKYHGDQLQLSSLKESYLYPEKQAEGMFGDVAWEMLYMNILWNTYEAIPIMKQMPSLSEAQQASITRSLEIYKELLGDSQFRDVALKNIGVLTAVSLISIYKESFSFEEVASMQDLMCTFEPVPITDNYELIRKRVLFLAEAFEVAGSQEQKTKYGPKIEEVKKKIPERIEDHQRQRYIDQVEKFKVGTCFR